MRTRGLKNPGDPDRPGRHPSKVSTPHTPPEVPHVKLAYALNALFIRNSATPNRGSIALKVALVLALWIAALGLGCTEPRSATGSTEAPASTSDSSRLPARASAQLASGPWGSPPQGSPEGWAARQQAQVNRFAALSGRGGLLLRRASHDALVPGPILASDIEIRVSGPIARVSVRQRFQNPSREWVEGLYIFPLPGDAAVDHMRVITASQTLEGEIQEKQQAIRTYTKARAEGKQAGLVEWQEPNLFSAAVANIEPGGEVTVEIEYQQSLAPESGVWSLRFPLALLRDGDVGRPSKTSSSSPPSSSSSPSSSSFAPVSFSPSPSLPSSPALLPSPGSVASSTRLFVDLAPGFAIFPPTSPHHAVRTAAQGGGYAVELTADKPGDARDFILRWKPLPGERPEAALFRESWGGRHQSLLVLSPPAPVGRPPASPPREVVFVVDTSGSMEGTSIRQARRALVAGVGTLAPGDHFNVLGFSDSLSALFEAAEPLTPETREAALAFVESLAAEGGTDMAPALERALRPGRDASGRVRQVVFITDGGVPDPRGLYSRIQRWVGESRVFMVGIGSAPNTYFMRKAARYGRGTYTAIGHPEEAEKIIRALFHKLGSLVLTEIELEFPSGTSAEVMPARIGDLYLGEPLVVVIESDRPLDWVGVRGNAGTAPWRVTVDGRNTEDRSGVHVLWGRQKIEGLLDAMRTEGDPGGAKAKAATALALEHHLVTPYTSLVAVEKIARRRDHENWVQKLVPTRVASASPPHLAIRFAQGATPAALQLALGAGSLAAAGVLARIRRRRS